MAKRTIADAGLTVREYVGALGRGGEWRGDSCGCPDSRCKGFHHEPDEPCGCLHALIRDILADRTTGAAGSI